MEGHLPPLFGGRFAEEDPVPKDKGLRVEASPDIPPTVKAEAERIAADVTAAAAAPAAPTVEVVPGSPPGWQRFTHVVDGAPQMGWRCPTCNQVKWSEPDGPCDACAAP